MSMTGNLMVSLRSGNFRKNGRTRVITSKIRKWTFHPILDRVHYQKCDIFSIGIIIGKKITTNRRKWLFLDQNPKISSFRKKLRRWLPKTLSSTNETNISKEQNNSSKTFRKSLIFNSLHRPLSRRQFDIFEFQGDRGGGGMGYFWVNFQF